MKTVFISLVLVCSGLDLFPQGTAISPHIMGQSYHLTNYSMAAVPPYTAYVFGSAPATQTQVWNAINQSGCKLMRIGGKQYNIGDSKPLTDQEVYYVTVIDDVRKNGCEPVLTLPFILATQNSNTAEPNFGHVDYDTAVARSLRNLRKIFHLVNTVHKRNVKYVIIGNEPDKDYKWSTVNSPTTSASQIAANIAGYIKPMADAIRSMPGGSAIKIIGPEYTHCLPEVYDLLFTPSISATYIGGTSTITGQPPYLDYISCHFYGPDFNGTKYGDSDHYNPVYGSWESRVNFCNIERYGKDRGEVANSPGAAKRYRGALWYLRKKAADCMPTRTGWPMGFMVTEMNSGHNNYTLTPSTASAAASGTDAISMQGAQNLARMYALAMEYGAASVMMWSVKEGAGTVDDRGYLTGSGGDKRPSYFHYRMLADYFKGTFYRDEVLANYSTGASGNISSDANSQPNPHWLHFRPSASNNTETVMIGGSVKQLSVAADFQDNLEKVLESKAFAAKGTSIAVMIINHSSSSVTAVFRMDGITPSTSADKRFSFNISSAFSSELFFGADVAGTASNTAIDANSTHVFIFDCTGQLAFRYRYRFGTEAQSYNTDFQPFYPGSGAPGTFTSAISGTVCYPGSRTISVTPGYSSYSWKLLPNNSYTPTTAAMLTSTVAGSYEIMVNTACGVAKTTAVLHQNSPLSNPGPSLSICVPPHTATMGDINMPSNLSYNWLPGNYSTATVALNPTTTPVSTDYTLTTWDGSCAMVSTVAVVSGTDANVVVRDHGGDNGLSVTSVTTWDSPDIWTRWDAADNIISDPPIAGQTNYVKVRVLNVGCANTGVNTVSVDLYYSSNNAPGIWPSQWNSFSCSNINIKPAPTCSPSPPGICGDYIGTVTYTGDIPAGGVGVLTFTWATPQNFNCPQVFNTIPNSWALLAHVDHPNDQLPTLTAAVNVDAQNSSNIARENLITIPGIAVGTVYFPVWMVNPFEGNPHTVDFVLSPDANGENVLHYADLFFYFQREVLDAWEEGGGESINLFRINDTMVQILDRNAQLLNLNIPEDRDAAIGIGFSPIVQPPYSGGNAFYVHAAQYNSWQGPDVPFGGITYEIKRAEWLCAGCDGEEELLNESFSSETNTQGAYNNQNLVFDYELIVENGQTAEFNNSKLSFGTKGKITVNHGGKLIINNCELKSRCPKEEWQGIAVTNTALAAGCLTITNSQIKGAMNPVRCESAEDILIENNIFISTARQTGTALNLQNCKSFQVTKNRVGNFATAIMSSGTYSSATGSAIEDNNVQNAIIAFEFSNDDHITTNINCNRLGYSAFGIKSTSTQLADFGSTSIASGNRFLGIAQLQNHKISHTGNSPAYYYKTGTASPGNMSINAYTASASFTCAQVGSARLAATQMLEIKPAIKDVRVIPNPNAGVFDIEFSKFSSGKTTIYISDIQGRNIKVIRLNEGEIKANVDLAVFAKGVYFGTLVSESGEKYHVKIMSQE